MVKTHRSYTERFDRAILLHRGIHAAVVADVNRRRSGRHFGIPNTHVFNGKDEVDC